jgi:Pel9A-like, right handed beta helix region/Secretion system C-terminal sorting domain
MFKIFLTIIFISISLKINAQIYVSPDGDDSNPGTIDKPYKSISVALDKAYEDSTIYLRGGVYELNATLKPPRSGSEGKLIKLWAYSGEAPTLDFSGQTYSSSSRGFNLSRDYWYFKGLIIKNAGDNGINISGDHNIIENCRLYGNKDTGLQISGGGGYNYVHNCDSYENYDSGTHGENADGFAPKLNIGPGNVFRGCRAWSNADDGWDFYESQNEVILDSCWSFANGFNIWGDASYQGDGNGFKVGGNYIPTHHLLMNCVAFDNRGKGFDQNHNTAGVTILNCTGVGNQNKNFSFPEIPKTGIDSLVNNLSYDGSNSLESSSVQVTNSWNGFSLSSSDFLSLDTSLAKTPREPDSSLTQTDLFRLAVGSSLINAGTDVGLPFKGTAPDIGAFESGIISSVNEDKNIPFNFNLFQNYPNPFNPTTKIKYSIPGTADKFAQTAKVEVAVYDILGNKVRILINKEQRSGNYEVEFDASNLPSGVYFYKLSAGNFHQVEKMILLK